MRRWGFFLYGVGCHALFLATYAYLAGFTGNLLVPKGIDSPPAGGLGEAGIDLLLIALFGVQHSVMARPRFKRVWTRLVPEPIERSTYVLLSCAATAVLMWQWRGLDGVVWDVRHPVARGLLWGVFALGWLTVPAVSLMIDHFDLFGTRQVWRHLRGRPNTPQPFRTPLLYGRVRHPLYVGWALAFWATPSMTAGHLLLAAALTLYMVVAARVEERDLVRHFGEVYRAYRRHVPMFLPRLTGGRRDPRPRPPVFDRRVLADPAWWHWAATVPLLAASTAGCPGAVEAAAALCAAMALYYLARLGRLRPFPVQVRVAYLGWLLVGMLPAMGWMHYVALAGTTAVVAVGYCPLGRLLSLLWFNRSERLSVSLVRRRLLSPPDGGIFFLRPPPGGQPTCSCSPARNLTGAAARDGGSPSP